MNYEGEAKSLLISTTHIETSSTEALMQATAAQAYATLAVAEQLRAANLISLFLAGPEGRPGGAADEFASDAYDRLADEDVRGILSFNQRKENQ